MNKKIKDFIYLDNSKLNSLYSQLFEGIELKILAGEEKSSQDGKETKHHLHGEKQESKVLEIKYEIEEKILYDHMYNKLESTLVKDILDLSAIEHDKTYMNKIQNAFWIKIKGKPNIYDPIKIVTKYKDKYNKFGEAIAYMNLVSSPEKFTKNTKIKDLAKELNLQIDQKILEYTKDVTDFFDQCSYEVVINMESYEDLIFRGILNKNYLRQDEIMVNSLYTSTPPIEWVMVGQVTYFDEEDKRTNNRVNYIPNIELDVKKSNNGGIYDALVNIYKSYNNIEETYLQSQKRKIHIAPIAIYTEKELTSDIE